MTERQSSARAPPGERYEAEARAWAEAGRPTPDDGLWRTALLYLWVNSQGAKRQGVSARLAEYLAARRAALDARYPGWYDGLFDERDFCAECGERYRLENLAICTDCGARFCFRHRSGGGPAPNGNDRCARCAMGELVG